MNKYALDACTLILLFSGNVNVANALRKNCIDNYILVPPIAYYEVLRGLLKKRATKKIRQLKAMYNNSVGAVNIKEKEVIEKAADIFVELSDKHFTVGSCDILIASWTILTNSILVTDNVKDFQNIDGLKIENWKES